MFTKAHREASLCYELKLLTMSSLISQDNPFTIQIPATSISNPGAGVQVGSRGQFIGQSTF